jgi:hypothetical protein
MRRAYRNREATRRSCDLARLPIAVSARRPDMAEFRPD